MSRPSRRSQANDDLIFAADAQAAYLYSKHHVSQPGVNSRDLIHLGDFCSFLVVRTID
jgi:hypothetical protein